MPLPNPDYLALAYYNWNGDQFDAALIDDSPSGSPAAAISRRDIRWNTLNNTDKQVVHGLIMGYADRNSLTEANALTLATAAGYQTVNFDGALAGLGSPASAGATGLANDTTAYVMNVSVNGGANQQVSIVGSAAQTFADLVVALNAQLPATVVASIFEGNLEFTTASAGAGNTVEIFDQTLLRSLNGFKQVLETRVGVDTIADVFDLNFKDSSNNQTYAELLIGSLRVVPDKPRKNPKTDQDIYFNHSTGVWTFLHSDVAV